MALENKSHFYDGRIYRILFDPALRETRQLIAEKIDEGSNVLDVGCGTGSLALELAEKCQRVVGIELSKKNLETAQERKESGDVGNVEFHHADATDLSRFADGEFDFATISMVTHEMPEDIRLAVLREIQRVAKEIVMADFACPPPKSIAGVRIRLTERFAGKDHYAGFKSFQKNGGIDGLAEEAGLRISSDSSTKNKTIRVVKMA